MTTMNSPVVVEVGKAPPLEYTNTNVLRLRLKGKTLQEIGDTFNVTNQAISKRLNNIYSLIDKDNLEAYKEHKSNIFTAVESALLDEALQPSKLKSMSSRDAMVSFGIMYDKNRLEQGKATEITANTSLILDVNSLLNSLKE